ncbi:ATP-binding cassette domain-containing protein [Pelomonas sp. SE-A7]|uniref:ATP-binding cassette domain-containing protein n=1 Tax=Pelomonas sp. SE-A7 TaxID=3054953 RepID=UPI00259CF148|nr:ATP-binding cassette domain-containing protein [Pelomonas sp. SE-A7]MDM4765563.1 ATP-binding cassette domain-containing protein [Pelomonas sp. SE-A7]
MTVLIELDQVQRHYSIGDIDVPALDGLSLSIQAGEFVAIIGASGSGKSTLMNLLGCLDQPTGGHFRLDGVDVGELEPDELAQLRREHFGFVFQRYHLLPHLDATSNAALPAVYAGAPLSSRRQRAEALLQRLGLGDRLHHRPNELSGGQQQRVSIARSLMNGGQIILADEPTGALDSHSGAELLGLLAELHGRGHTIILVTHDPKVAAHARRVIELEDGKLLRDSGTPAEHRAAARPDPEGPSLGRAGWLRQRVGQWREALITAWHSLKGNRLRTALSMLGICIGIASVVTIVALSSAAREKVESGLRGFMSGRIPVYAGNHKLLPGVQPRPFRQSELDVLATLPGVKSIVVKRETSVSLRHGSKNSDGRAIAAEPGDLADRKLRLVEGRQLSSLELQTMAPVVLIDQNTRKALFKPGQPVLGTTLLLESMASAGMARGMSDPNKPLSVAPMPMTVVGVFDRAEDAGMDFDGYGNRVLMPRSTYLRKLDNSTDVPSFDVLLDNKLPPDEVTRQVTHRLRALHGQEDFRTMNLDGEFRKFQEVTGAISLVFAGIGAIALLVGGVGVMNIMLVSVSERTREIGIRMAVGARQGDVRLQFLIEAVLLCCLGGFAGLGLSWLAAQGINAVQKDVVVQVSWQALCLAFGISSLVGLVFGTLPARRAAALSPVDALARE